jgi:hypothetical protein
MVHSSSSAAVGRTRFLAENVGHGDDCRLHPDLHHSTEMAELKEPQRYYNGHHAFFIAERPELNEKITPLKNFKQITIGQAYVRTEDRKFLPLGEANPIQLAMFHGTHRLATPEGLTSNVAFTDVWLRCE